LYLIYSVFEKDFPTYISCPFLSFFPIGDWIYESGSSVRAHNQCSYSLLSDTGITRSTQGSFLAQSTLHDLSRIIMSGTGPRESIFPTRMALTNTKARLKGAQTGHSLLAKKRDALTTRFRAILRKVDEVSRPRLWVKS
jgi:hypothetical protein